MSVTPTLTRRSRNPNVALAASSGRLSIPRALAREGPVDVQPHVARIFASFRRVNEQICRLDVPVQDAGPPFG